MWLLSIVCWLFLSTVGWASPLPVDNTAKAYAKKSKEEKEKEQEAAKKAEEKAKKERSARVIVLKWQNTSTNHKNGTLKRNVKSAISRTEVLFLPAVDLFQGGRQVKIRTLAPIDQPAIVPEDAATKVMSVVDEVAAIGFDALTGNQWAKKAEKLRNVAEEIWFVDRVELREPLFMLYAQIGRAVNNVTDFELGPPFFASIGGIGGRRVNYYWYLAATLAFQDPGLVGKLKDPDSKEYINAYYDQLKKGLFPTMKIDFQMEDSFKKKDFEKEYEVLLNGLPMSAVNELGQKEIFLGRTDIYLKRQDGGHGLSDRYEAIKTGTRSYNVLDDARKRMTIDFIRQLFLFEGKCYPNVDNEILTFLAIYAKLHPKVQEEIYVAVPKHGNPNRVWVWKFDPQNSKLELIAKGNDDFPIHFVAHMGLGALYNGATLSFGKDKDPNDAVEGNTSLTDLVDGNVTRATLPVYFDLRMHYTSFLVHFGWEFGYNFNESKWQEYIQTPTVDYDPEIKTVRMECTNPEDLSSCSMTSPPEEIYQEASWNRTFHFGVGWAFGRDAAYGLGPRIVYRNGFTNMPHSWTPTLNFGWTLPVPGVEPFSKRVRLILDIEGRAGANISLRRSLYYDTFYDAECECGGVAAPVFGLTMGFGTTF